jgi:hypothetical protein
MRKGHLLKFLLVILIFPCLVRADDLYHVRPLSEQEVLTTYRDILRDACRYGDRDWKTAAFDPAAGYWGDGVSLGNQGIRTIGGMILACATSARYDDTLSDADRAELLSKAISALRYVAATHVSGNQKCTDGKSWGATTPTSPQSWQSGMWTSSCAFGAWLIWDKLDSDLQQQIERVVAAENDFLIDTKPRNNLWLDTKAEENGWEVPCLVIGEVMFPKHVHAAAWHQAAVRYMMNTLCTDADTRDEQSVEGQPVKQWVGGANIQPDFTLENHNIFHPSYVGCSSYFLTQASMYYTFAGKPVSPAAYHHLLDTWHMFQTIQMPWGEAVYPQGMDWELHGLPFINLLATFATRDRDPFASCLEQYAVQYFRAWQKIGEGNLAFPGSRLGVIRHSINAEQCSYGLLAHKIFGPSTQPLSTAQATEQEQGVRDYPYVDFIAQRTTSKFVSMSWKNRIMGLVIPIGDGHLDNPSFCAPIQNGLVGSFDLVPRGDVTAKVLEHSREINADGFTTIGTLLLNGGRLKQTLRLVSIGPQTAVYEDHVTAQGDVTVHAERGVPVGIENDPITFGLRTVTDENGQRRFEWKHSQPAAALSGAWANVDGRLGIVTLAGSGMTYAQASGYTRGMSVGSDVLYGSFSDKGRSFKSGEEVTHRVAIFYLEVNPEQTAALAKSCRIDADGKTLHVKQPDGSEVQLPAF